MWLIIFLQLSSFFLCFSFTPVLPLFDLRHPRGSSQLRPEGGPCTIYTHVVLIAHAWCSYLSSVSLIHPAILAQTLKLRVGHAASRLVVQSSAEAEHSPALEQRGELGPTAPFLLVVDVTPGPSSQDGKLRETRDTRSVAGR